MTPERIQETIRARTRFTVIIIILMIGGCASSIHQIYACPYIIPQAAYEAIVASVETATGNAREIERACGAEALGCVVMPEGARPVIYTLEGLSPADAQDVMFHEICHVYERESGRVAGEEVLRHEGWISR